jgi:phosphoglycerate dehydrogenase-like enzyme
LVLILSDVPLSEVAVHRLQNLPGVTVHRVPCHDQPWNVSANIAREVKILLCKLPPQNLDALPGLELIQLSTVGYEHLRHLNLGNLPLRVCNARGVFDTAIAEWCLAMMVNLARDLPAMFRNQQQANWERADRFQQDIRGKTLGLWGYGGIGRATARLAKAYGMNVHAMTRSGVRPRIDTYVEPGTGDPEGTLPDRIYTLAEASAFLGGLDFLVLSLPRTQQTDGMIGEEQLRSLPRTAFVLNPARGPIIQEPALLRALEHRWIAGAALDTHYAYPLPPDHPLWRLRNVILTPHISGADKSGTFPGRMADLFFCNVERYLRAEPLLNELTAQEWLEA